MLDCLIKNGIVVFPDDTREVDLAIRDNKIIGIGTRGSFPGAKKVVDAAGAYVFAGGVDPHVHVHWPFLAATTADTYSLASRAAAMGGTTTFIDFAHPKMGARLLERVSNRRMEIGTDSVLDYSLHCVVSNRDPETLAEIGQLVEQGITSFKMYMTYSRRKIMADDSTLYFVMQKAAETGALACVHAENGPLGDALESQFASDGRTRATDFPQHKPNFIEEEAVERAIFWAKKTGARLYIFHLSTAEGLKLVRRAQQKGYPIIAETCPQYLLFDDSVFASPTIGHRFICSPPIRSKKDTEALWEGLAEGTIAAVGTDHCAFTTSQKDVGIGNFLDVPNGLPGIETRLFLIWTEGVSKKRITPEQFTQITSNNPARIFGLHPRKGNIGIGSDADLVIFDPSTEWVLSHQRTHMGVDWSPYEGWKIRGRILYTIVRGSIIVEDGEFLGHNVSGKFIPRNSVEPFTRR